jgi:hypothetical protein
MVLWKKMNLFFLIPILVMIVYFISLPFAAHHQSTASSMPVSYAFVQTAKLARIQASSENETQFQLILEETSPFVTYFSDRPNRITGAIPLDEFLNFWHHGVDSFQADPPNVSVSGQIHIRSQKERNLFFIFELAHPNYVKESRKMIYDIQLLSPSPLLHEKTILLHDPILFFDDGMPQWCPSCCCGDVKK